MCCASWLNMARRAEYWRTASTGGIILLTDVFRMLLVRVTMSSQHLLLSSCCTAVGSQLSTYCQYSFTSSSACIRYDLVGVQVAVGE